MHTSSDIWPACVVPASIEPSWASCLTARLLPMAGAMLMLDPLAGCAASGTGDKIALNDSDRSAQPATQDDTIVFEFGVGLSDPTKCYPQAAARLVCPRRKIRIICAIRHSGKWPRPSASQTRPTALTNITMPDWRPPLTRPKICGSCRWK